MGRRKKKKATNHFIRPYIKYWKQPELCEKVRETYFEYLEDENIKKCHIITDISKMYKMPRNTLVDWTNRWKKNEFYDPSDTSIHGDFHKVFTEEQEKEIYDVIYNEYISKNIFFSDKQFISIAYDKFFEFYPDGEKVFECSSHFISYFKKRHQISSRLAHYKRRKNIDIYPEIKIDTIETFTVQINSLIEYAKIHDEPVINADETAWYILPSKLITWALTGSKSVQINVDDREKVHISVMCSITSDFEKLPLFFIAKGKTERSEHSQLGDIG